MTKHYLFVCGCPRSGTTALTHILNWHSDAVIGMERYAVLFQRNAAAFLPSLFRLPRFSHIQKGDCGYSSFEDAVAYRAPFSRRFDPVAVADALYVGDKITQLYDSFDVFEKEEWRSTSTTIVQIVRNPYDVARSYEKRMINPKDRWQAGYKEGVQEWCKSVSRALEMKQKPADGGARLLIVNYEHLFSDDCERFTSNCRELFSAIGLSFTKVSEEGLIKVQKNTAVRATKRGEGVSHVTDDLLRQLITTEYLTQYETLQKLAVF